jgi:hypothetical protein
MINNIQWTPMPPFYLHTGKPAPLPEPEPDSDAVVFLLLFLLVGLVLL